MSNISDFTIFNPIIYPTSTTLYIVKMSTIEGCDVTDSVMITVNEIIVDAGEDTAICKGASIILGGNPTAVAGSLFNWSPSNSLDDDGKANPIATPTDTTVYILNVSNLLGCSSTDTISIEVIIHPSTDTTFEICKGFNLSLNPSNENVTYLWNTGETTRQIVVTDAGYYFVNNLTNEGCLITDSFSVIVNDCELYFYVPTAFTPNNDDTLNNVFTPITEGLDSLYFAIFNRWGDKIFESDDFTPWDGTFQGSAVMEGVYAWIAHYVGKGYLGRNEKSAAGIITLIR